jgi:lactate dehydrogenase-like 2-hydroxyacid dehydrogenase
MPHPFRLLVTRRFPPAIEARAAASYAVTRWHPAGPGLVELSQDADALFCGPADRLDAALIDALSDSVRVIGTFSVGFEHIAVAAARARGIKVVNTPGVLSDATAEFTMLLILAAARRAGESERQLRAGSWLGPPSPTFLGTQVSGKRLGIFGMGRIGQVLARMAAGFDMQLHYRNRRRLPPELEAGARWHETDAAFLAACDVLALCAPGGSETRHWLNSDRIAQLPRGAIVVNTARGSLVDDAALTAALRDGHVAAAGLDVFAEEPLVPADYLALENVVLTPHIASATWETRNAMGNLVLDGIGAVLAGQLPPNLVED